MSPPTPRDHLITLLSQHLLIPEILPISLLEDLKGPLMIHYPDTKEGQEVVISLGEEVERSKVQEEPILVFEESDPTATYTLIMTDPDLFKHHDQISGQVRHWLQSGIVFGEDHRSIRMTQEKREKETVNTDYIGPAPGPGTGLHRYTFILASEPHSYIPSSLPPRERGPAILKDRMQFSAQKYLEDEGLKVEAVGFMRVGADFKSAITNAALAGESLVAKVLGK